MWRAVSGRSFKAAPGSSGWRDRGVAVRRCSGVKPHAVQRSRMENVTDPTTLGVRWLDDRPELRRLYGDRRLMKVVHFVRHGEGTHNVGKEYRDERHFDAPLTAYGEEQCAALAEHTALLSNVQLVVTSTMTRAVQTALLSCPWHQSAGIPFVALESVRETVNYVCDCRRSTSEIAREFGDRVDFSLSPEEDELKLRYDRRHGSWDEHTWHRESDDPLHIAARARSFFAWLAARQEEEVLVSTHSAFLWHLFNHGHEGYVQNERFTEAARVASEMTPVVEYGADIALEQAMRARWENCELRSMVIVYGQPSD